MYNTDLTLSALLIKKPDGRAKIKGAAEYPNINGSVKFYQTANGVIVYAVISGLPKADEKCSFMGFHIHQGESCSGNADDPFADAKGHYNPENTRHPNHAGDMPALMNCGGRAILLFLTKRFSVKEIKGKTVIIHNMPDDFTSQPSGNSGMKIACGKIV